MKKNLKYYLKGILNVKELALMPTSFDVVGDIMIFAEFPKQLSKKEKKIGNAILENYHNIKTILKKTKKYSGKYRTPTLKIVAGERRKETVCKENNVLIKLNVEKVYFSPRMATERKRVADLVKPNESVLVMFSGSGVYPLVIAKNSKCKEAYGVEINPAGHKYALENVKKNKLENKVFMYKGDAMKIVPKLKKKFDRILMPLPKDAERYLEVALKHAKKGAIVHFYDFLQEDESYKAVDKIRNACLKAKKEFRIIDAVKCGQYSPGFYRFSIDFFVA
jgi:tRNA (guanine37-N1)-methyltransferase